MKKRGQKRERKIYGKTVLREFRAILKRFIRLVQAGVIEAVQVFKGRRVETVVPLARKVTVSLSNGRTATMNIVEGFYEQTFRIIAPQPAIIKEIFATD